MSVIHVRPVDAFNDRSGSANKSWRPEPIIPLESIIQNRINEPTRGVTIIGNNEKKTKSQDEMDVDPHQADKFLNENASETLIHGHTHRPGKYFMPSGRVRWVIQDWRVEDNITIGGGLMIEGQRISVLRFFG